jgi:hypothetical protein
MNEKKRLILVVMLCLNEEACIGRTIRSPLDILT